MGKAKLLLSRSFVFGYNKEKYSEIKILQGILENNDKMIIYIYNNFFPGIKSMVNAFHTSYLDAEDVFQEGLTRAIINVRDNKFNGRSSFYTYLTSICRNVCLREIRDENKWKLSGNRLQDETEIESNEEELISHMSQIINKMDDFCKNIIDLRFGLQGAKITPSLESESTGFMKFEEIAKQLNIETDNARQRFKRCFEKFKIVLCKDPHWRELVN